VEPDGLPDEDRPTALHQAHGVLEPVEHVRRAPDHEGVVLGDALDGSGSTKLRVDPGRLELQGDPLGNPLRGAVPARVGDQDAHVDLLLVRRVPTVQGG
jgi:hypothetical protein